MVSHALHRLFAPEYMVKESLVKGSLPQTKEAYQTAFGVAGAAMAESLFIALIGMADTVMVSTVGERAIAAVGLAGQPRYLVQTIAFAMNVAVTSICARRKGEEDRDGALRCLKQSVLLSAVLSIVLSVVFMPFSRDLILFMGAESDTVFWATQYFQILLLGIPFNNLSLTICAAQRGIGNTKVSMWTNMSANAVNLVLNYGLINGKWGLPRLEVAGAAIATIIGWAVGLVIALLSVAPTTSYLHLYSKGGWSPDKKLLVSMWKVSSGSFVEQVCMRVGFISYSKIVAGLGTLMLAAHHIFINILSLSFSFGDGLSISAASLVGQNLGAERPDLSIVYGKVCQRMALIASTAVFILFAISGKDMIRLFSSDTQILDVGRVILIFMGIIVFGQSAQMVFMGCLRGAGDTMYTAIISMFSITLLRPALAFLFAYTLGWGLIGAWGALLADQYLRLVLTYRRFSSGNWVSIKL
jgi:putative efflux protein, MATE family